MTNLDARIEELRCKLEDEYLKGNIAESLHLSRQLDRLIALAQREGVVGETLIIAAPRQDPDNLG